MNAKVTISPDRLRELLAALKAKQTAELPTNTSTVPADNLTTTDKYGNTITYNSAQMRAVTIAGSGKNAVILGAAGTGKTTCMKGVVQSLIALPTMTKLIAGDHKHLLPANGSAGIVIVAFTKIAVNNIRRNMPLELQNNCITVHKLLEFQPTEYDVIDPVTLETKTSWGFKPNRDEYNPLPESIHTIIFEESSMLGTDLYELLRAAMKHPYQEIFLGDIQQLAPVFGPAILGFKMLEYQTIELTEVYRQALDNKIIALAHRVISGKPIPASEFHEWNVKGQLCLHHWKKKISALDACATLAQFLAKAYDNAEYDPEQDIILCPYAKSDFGTDEINKYIGNFLRKKFYRECFEILAGYNKHYLCVDDKVLVDREAGIIKEIKINQAYYGRPPQASSINLDYWGCMQGANENGIHSSSNAGDYDIDKMLDSMASGEDRKTQASHVVTIQLMDTDRVVELKTSAEINDLMLGYALTVHKSQGSEWRKVFFVTNHTHNTMIQRELLYTGITRARESLYFILDKDHLVNGILSQRIKGETLEEKAEYFKGKLRERGNKDE